MAAISGPTTSAAAVADGSAPCCSGSSRCPEPTPVVTPVMPAPIRAGGGHGDQRLVSAARDGDFKKIRRLLQKHRVNVNARDPSTGNTALMVASLVQDPDAMSELLQHGADPTLHSYTGQNCLDSLPASLVHLVLGFPDYLLKESPHRSNEERRLLLAAWSGQRDEVQHLLSQTGNGGLDINCTNAEGSTPLVLVCRDLATFQELASAGVLRSYDPLGVIRVLLDHGILIHRDVNHQDRQGRTALHYASHTCCEHTAPVISLLLQNEAKVDIKDKHGFSPLHFASQAGSVDAIQLLLDAGADPSATGLGGIAPLHLAASAGKIAAVRLLLERGADVLSFAQDGKSPLCCAGSTDVYSVLRRAVESALCERADKLRLTPLEHEKRKLGQLILQSRNVTAPGEQSSPGSSTAKEEGSSSSDKEPSEPEAEAVLKTKASSSSHSVLRGGDPSLSAFRRYQPPNLPSHHIPGWRQKSSHGGSHFIPVRPRDHSSDDELRHGWCAEGTLENNSYHRQKTMPSNTPLELPLDPHSAASVVVEAKNGINSASESEKKVEENILEARTESPLAESARTAAWVFGGSTENVVLKEMYAKVRPKHRGGPGGGVGGSSGGGGGGGGGNGDSCDSESGDDELKQSASRKRPSAVAQRRKKTQHYAKNYHLSRLKLRPELAGRSIPDVAATVPPKTISAGRQQSDVSLGAAEDAAQQKVPATSSALATAAAPVQPKFSLITKSKEGSHLRPNGSRMPVPSTRGLMSKFLPPWVTRDDVSSHLSSASWVYLPSLSPEEGGDEPRLSLPRKEEIPEVAKPSEPAATTSSTTAAKSVRPEGTHTLTCGKRGSSGGTEGSAFHTVSAKGKGSAACQHAPPEQPRALVPPLPKNLSDIPAFPSGPPFPWIKGKLIGKGAFGLVWCGLRKSGGELVAVKQFQLGGADVLSAVQLEVDILQSLKHPNIVGFLGVQQEEALVNLFLEFVSGGSLAANLAQFGAFPETVVRRYGRQLLQALAYLHQRNVIHRDIKGNNVMVCPGTGTIKLIDFGCATFEPSSADCEGLVASARGTPYWMAPEVICQEECSHKSDVWSVGCTVIEMFQTKPPWYELSPLAAAFAIGQGTSDPKFPDQISPDARDFILTCLKRCPGERPTAEELLTHRFLQTGAIEDL
ncbi:uncharacterized protein [Dermacentor andersoni]|uniref:uncharacterized protein isoform X1 n=1 Tax=Dermacentor andersoni TaxID=34620 RepID=UPI0021559776|nr:uncharacterized protein LOC126539426 isoform X1 [Dermacentor andersoni]XP_050042206.1 uncharacterized protein LOC126539426 isoform X1 [Dermacentor andersoni]